MLVLSRRQLAREADDFVGMGPPSGLAGGEGSDGGSGGGLGQEELNLDGLVPGEL